MQAQPETTTTEEEVRFARRVAELEGFGHRRSTSAQERRAADHLAGSLRSLGLEVTIEPFNGSASMAARLLVHVLVAAAGAALVRAAPVASLVLSWGALASLVAEQMTWGAWLSWFLCRSPSQNVVGRVPSAKGTPARRIVVSAHYDTQTGGWVWPAFNRVMPYLRALPPTLKQPMLPVVLMVWGQVVLAAVVLTHRFSLAVALMSLLLMVAYLVTGVLLAQWALSPAVPGAADNASGVAAALQLAEDWVAAPAADDVELVVLLTGCEESGLLGAAAWADRHRAELRALPTAVLNIDCVGMGPPRFLGAEVPAAGYALRVPPDLRRACQSVAAELGLAGAGPHAAPGPTDSLAFLARGIPAVTIAGWLDGPRMPHYHTPQDTLAHMNLPAAVAGRRFASAVLERLANPSAPSA